MNKKKNRRSHWVDMFLVLMVMGVIFVTTLLLKGSFSSPQDLAEFLREQGPVAPLIFIAIEIIEVVAAPLPGMLFSVAAGYTFGALPGAAYSYVGNTIGTLIAFLLARHFGRPLVEKLIDAGKLKEYDRLFHQHGQAVLWIVFLMPIFPADILSFVAGLSSLKLKLFASIISIAYIPYILITSLFGASLYSMDLKSKLVLSGIVLVVFVVVYSFGAWYMKKEKKSPKRG